jgi:MFS transporter, MHS family, proline/betaine transporter
MSTAESALESPLPLAPPQIAEGRAICAAIAGNTLEWYDFAVYGYFAPAIGRQFFPAESHSAQLLASFGAFAAGFFMRPIGGLLFGHLADRIGRSPALTLSVLTMAVPTFLIGVLPGKATLGILAPVILVLLRMAQGLAVGGEYTTSAVYLTELVRGRRGLAASWSPFGATAGTLLGSAAGVLTTRLVPADSIDTWGWRVPFLCGLILGVLGLLLRRHMPEPTVPDTSGPQPASADLKSPLPEPSAAFKWRTVGQLVCLSAFLSVGFYVCFVFSVTYFTDFVHVSARSAFDINSAAMVVLLLTIPIAGALSDVVGRRPILLASTLGGCLFGWPLFWLMHRPHPLLMLAGQIGLALIIGLFSGVLPVAMAEALPRRIRCTSLSLAYNLGMAVMGGTAPLVATYLIHRSHNDLSPAYYLIASAAISLAAALRLPETARSVLRVR